METVIIFLIYCRYN